MVVEVLEACRPRLIARDLQLTCLVAPDIRILGGQAALRAIVEDTIGNAIAATADGGTIGVTLSRIADAAQLAVADRRPPDGLDRITQLFDRYPAGPSQDAQTARAGPLWRVKQNAEALGGHVTASAVPGGSVLVQIVLPDPDLSTASRRP
jgi:sensor histidine kinase regulating citrate/malate metabolism